MCVVVSLGVCMWQKWATMTNAIATHLRNNCVDNERKPINTCSDSVSKWSVFFYNISGVWNITLPTTTTDMEIVGFCYIVALNGTNVEDNQWNCSYKNEERNIIQKTNPSNWQLKTCTYLQIAIHEHVIYREKKSITQLWRRKDLFNKANPLQNQ